MKVRRRPALWLGGMVVVVGLLLWAGRSWLRRERRAAAWPSLRVHEPSLRHCLEVHAPPAAGLTGSDARARKRVAAPWLDGLRALATLGLTATLLLARETTGSTIAYFTASKNVLGSLGAASQFAPTGLTATESDEAASLAWTAPAGGWATAYRVYRATTSGGPYTLLSTGGCAAPVSGTSCVDGTVGAGTYHYVVRGISGRGGSGVDSNQASVTIGGEGLLYYPQASLVEEELPARASTPSSTPSPASSATSTPSTAPSSAPTLTATLEPTATHRPQSTATQTAQPPATERPGAAVTDTPEATGTSTPEPDATGVVEPTSTAGAEPTATEETLPTSSPEPQPTNTPTPPVRADPTATASVPAALTSTPALELTASSTPTPTATNSPSPAATSTTTATRTPVATTSSTPLPTRTPTPSATAATTPGLTATSGSVASPTPTATAPSSPTPIPCPGDGRAGVYFYAERAFAGACTYTVEDISDFGETAVGDDTVSSIRIVGNWEVQLYKGTGFKGASDTFVASEPDLDARPLGGQYSSARIGERATPTPAHTATHTPQPTATSTPEPTATNTPEPTATFTPEPTATFTPEPTATFTPEPTSTSTPEPTATSTPEPTATSTPEPTATSTPEPTATSTPEPTATSTPEPTATEVLESVETEVPEPTATIEGAEPGSIAESSSR